MKRLPRWTEPAPFRRLLGARLSSQFADGVFQASLVSYELFSPEKSPDAPSIAVGLAVVLLPFSVVGPFAGTVLDRVDRRRTLVASGLLRALLALGAAAAVQGDGSGPALAVVAVAVLACSRLVLSALSAALPLVTPPGDLVAAQSFSATAGTAATGIGVALGGLLRVAVGSGGLAVVCVAGAVAYAAAGAAAARCTRRGLGPDELAPGGLGAAVREAGRDVAAGARHVWSLPRARRALVAINVGRLGYGLVFVDEVLVLHSGRPGVSGLVGIGAVGATLGLGTVAGAVAAPRLARRWGRTPVVIAALAIGGAGALLFVPPAVPWLLVASAPLLGFAQQAGKVTTDAIVQLEVDDEHRGRAFSLLDMAFSVSYVLAGALAAAGVPRSGDAPVTTALAGAVWAGAAGWLALAGRQRSVAAEQPGHG